MRLASAILRINPEVLYFHKRDYQHLSEKRLFTMGVSTLAMSTISMSSRRILYGTDLILNM